jgi:endonuclease YncB( thermonuclease family)
LTTEERYCPRCGRPRTGFFRYCSGCQLDFDSVPNVETSPVEAVTPIVETTPEPDPSPTEQVAVGAVTASAWQQPVTTSGWQQPQPASRRPSKRALRYGTIGVVALLGLGAISNLATTPTGVPTASAALASVTPAASAKPSPTFGPTGPTQVATVTKVVDGDTIRVSIDGVEYPVRYIGIDTPEPSSKDPIVKAFADSATAANEALVGGREVVLERDVSETDQFDRLLRDVWLIDGAVPLLVNAELVRRGFAKVTTYPPDDKYVDLLTAAQNTATRATLGIWAPAPTASPAVTPAPTPTPVVAFDDTDYDIDSESRTTFRGGAGTYTYTALAFIRDRATVRWAVTAPRKQSCRVAWRLEPEFDGTAIKSTVRVAAGATKSGNRRYTTSFADASFVVDSTCSKWTMSFQGYEPAAAGGGNCDPSYPSVCIPPYPPDLDCGDISFRRFDVIGSDPHGFDSDNDGIGCESG